MTYAIERAPLVFLDTETTGLGPDDEVWEFAAVRRTITDGREVSRKAWHYFVLHDERKAERLPEPFRADHDTRYQRHAALTRAELASLLHSEVFAVPDGTPYHQRPHVVGAVPSFDTGHLERILRAHGRTPGWHHHLVDVETLVVGWLRAWRAAGHPDAARVVGPPWDSDELSRAVGVDPAQFARHTAMGDVEWGIAMFDVVMGITR